MAKNLYKLMIRFNRELYIEYAAAYSEQQVKVVIARRIAKKQGVLPVMVLGWMKDHPESFEITIEIKYNEV